MSHSEPEKGQKAGVLTLVKVVLWSFLGVRGKQGYASDAAKITLPQVIVAGIIGGIIFVVGVLLLVRIIVTNVGVAS